MNNSRLWALNATKLIEMGNYDLQLLVKPLKDDRNDKRLKFMMKWIAQGYNAMGNFKL